MEKIKKHKEIVIATTVLLTFIFYWIQIRPVTAKKECSWFTETISADAGVTRVQAEANKKAFGEKCDATQSYQGYQGMSGSVGVEGRVQCAQLYKGMNERLPRSEKEVIREATKDEYSTCLRHNGL